ncbi:MAG TPA: alkaline phosphatase family protein [Tenuifilaceae bacterium]|nr:alkaline phosphatase family protein [Tenuifilaceae bacterium]
MHLKRLSLLILFTAGLRLSLWAQPNRQIPSEKPRLIVEIVASQMRFDYLTRYWDKFSDGGFKMLVNDGASCKNARYSYLLTQAYPGIATISTGANPSIHGIISDSWFSRVNGEVVDAVADEKTTTTGGSFASGRASAKNLVTSTLGDEICLNNPQSKVVSIALDAGSAYSWPDIARVGFTGSTPKRVDGFPAATLATAYPHGWIPLTLNRLQSFMPKRSGKR